MFALSEFNKLKLQGYIYSINERYSESLYCFNDALNIKEDGQIYCQMAYCYAYIKDYKEAQKCALKAIEIGFDAYELYAKITVGNLADMDNAVKVLNEGVKNRKASACFTLAYYHYDNNLIPDMRDPFKCCEYLELAYKCAEPYERAEYSYRIANLYKILLHTYPYLEKTIKNKPFEFMKIFNQYGGALYPSERINIYMFNEASRAGDESIFDILFNRFDGDSELIFALMLLDEKYREKNENKIDDIALLLIKDSATKYKNPAASLLYTYSSSSSKRVLKSVYKKAGDYSLYVPNDFKEVFSEYVKCYEELLVEKNQA